MNMEKVVRKLAVCCLLLFAFAGRMMAQDDPQFVIKRRIDAGVTGDHYLAHVVVHLTNPDRDTIVLQDATTFDPETCLWYSGNTRNQEGINHNYYFHDGTNYRFLSAPLTPDAPLSLSDSLIPLNILKNSEHIYYFWDWDWDNKPIDGGGVARGKEHFGYTTAGSCANDGYSWGSSDQCWEVYWVECTQVEGTLKWKLTQQSHYTLNNPLDLVPNAARFRNVDVTEHDTEILNESGGLTDLTLESDEMEFNTSQTVTADITTTYTYDTIQPYSKYAFIDKNGTTVTDYAYYYYVGDNGNHSHGPDTLHVSTGNPTYQWSVSSDVAQYLSIAANNNDPSTATLSYTGAYPPYHQTATVKVTVTYQNGATQERTATVLLKTVCHNPSQSAAPVVLYDFVTVSWYETADSYILTWTKSNDEDWNNATSVTVVGSESYTITGLEYNTNYKYKVVAATCNDPNDPEEYNFKTGSEPGLLVFGAVYGGGRMANVGGKTEMAIINCDSIHAVYGGNDIAGVVLDTIAANHAAGYASANITLGVDANDAYSTEFNEGKVSKKVRIGDVYGGGNGYYAYNGVSFAAATTDTDTIAVLPGDSVSYITPMFTVGKSEYTNTNSVNDTLVLPRISKTAITVSNNSVKIDSLFGGAKNAFLTYDDYHYAGDSIHIKGGTILAVFGGNNIGGGQGYGKHYIQVDSTKIYLHDSIVNTATTGYGRDFGIRYLFGGGNKVKGSTTEVVINGGQCDTIFGGGNEADVYGAYMTVNVPIEANAGSGVKYGRVYSEAIDSYTTDDGITTKSDYKWDGINGIYNVRTLFGGNNKAPMEKVPHIALTSGSIGTAYGGGNQGDMMASDSLVITGDDAGTVLVIDGNHVKYGTHVEIKSDSILIDYLYGGCQMSNVYYSTWLEMKKGHVGNVYGGCNVSGDVGSTRINPELVAPNLDDPNLDPQIAREYFLEYQKVQGATYVVATGGTVYKNLFGGSNGYYHCNDGLNYKEGIDYGDTEHQYIGKPIPTHNETHAIINGVTIKGDAYAGGNLAPVGFNSALVGDNAFPQFVGLASLNMSNGTVGVENALVGGNVYGGGNMAAVYGSNEVKVSGGYIYGALYGGNDHLGKVADPTSRALPSEYDYASDGLTPLSLAKVRTYVSVTGKPHVNTVYGGGNGDYDYTVPNTYCNPDDQPIQSNTFVDINIDGFPNETEGGRINTVYGGGNGVTVTGFIKVFLNVKGVDDNTPPVAYDHVGTIFGGNNKGSLDILSDVILLKGQVNTVYGGCNKGAMLGSNVVYGRDSTRYVNVGSMVRLRNEYLATVNDTLIPSAVVSNAVYAGCRMNDVSNNSLVLVEGGIHTDTTMIFGGCDISGDVRDNHKASRVVITAGTHDDGPLVGDVYGGGNGNYFYEGNKVYADTEHEHLIDSIKTGDILKPFCDSTSVEMYGGTATNLYGGGLAGPCGVTYVLVEGGTVAESVYGGGKEAGTEKQHSVSNSNGSTEIVNNTGNSTVIVDGGTVNTGIYGGCHNSGTIQGNVSVNIHAVCSVNDTIHDGIYGGGFGAATETAKDVTVTIDKKNADAPTPVIYSDVYGGSAFGKVNHTGDGSTGLTKVDFKNGKLHGTLFGGGKGGSTPGPNDSTLVFGNVKVNIFDGNLYGGIYGGCNAKGSVEGNIEIFVNGGVVSSDTLYNGTQLDTIKNGFVFGGGFGERTTTLGNVTVNVDTLQGSTIKPYIYGDVYGGSGLGSVNVAGKSTTVNILNGYIKKTTLNGNDYGGDVYGGGLGQKSGYNGATSDIFAKVNGKVYVNIGSGVGSDCDVVLSGNATIEGEVYGCNNLNGSPQDSVFVNIYKTAHVANPNNYYIEIPNTGLETETDSLNWLKNLPHDTVNYAISSVFGGGNRAAYTPPLTEAGLPRCATVHVWGCKENTIYNVYGGGNAANVGDTTANGKPANTQVIIDGGRIHQMFGGGNGYSATANHEDPSAPNYNPGANIFGTASSHVLAGLIDEVYGGANQWGSIDTIDLNVMSRECCKAAIYGKVFGCANEAPINHSIATTVGCGVGPIGELYGGSNLADIGMDDNTEANVTLNVYGGKYQSVFGGSKGRRPGTNNESDLGKTAHIHGNVTLNIYGGTIVKAFGGSDQYGNVFGTITVNVDTIQANCPAVIDTVFGAGNLTYYTPSKVDGQLITSPRVNIINGTVRKAVYGAGMGETAITRANPLVIIGDTVATHALNEYRLAIVGNADGVGDVYGGGYAGEVKGGPTVNILKSNTVVRHRVFGGGDMASIDSTLTTIVNVYDGTIGYGIYGGCHSTGTVADSIAVNILGGVLGTAEAKMPEGIFGGGYGADTKTDDNIFVNIEIQNTDTVFADVYGGSALGEVGAAGTLAKVEVKNGSTVKGKIFGGGMGDSSTSAMVTGHTELAIEGTVLDSIFGGCNVHGVVEGNTLVCVTGSGRLGSASPAILANAYGGGLGQNTKVKGDVDVTVNGNTATVYGDVYGGSAMGLVNCNDDGNAQNGYAKTNVILADGTVHGSIYGGGHGIGGADANVYGPVTVKIKGGNVINVFGCNNTAGAPQDSVSVLVTGGYMDSIFGGGNVAAYVLPSELNTKKLPFVHVSGGEVYYKVAGGGNAANVNGNPYVLISDGTESPKIGTSTADNNLSKGIYGGCNTTGTVTGNVLVELEGGIIGVEGNGTTIRNKKANIHGGGYGQPTQVLGNVTVNFGKIYDNVLEHSETPTLYGDLYGGSAFGDVNQQGQNHSTTVNILNGAIKSYHGRKQLVDQDSVIFGKAFGGGLGSKVGDIQAKVYGTVQVNVGYASNPDYIDTYIGQANLVECDVFGCNNQNGSPQQEVFVDVYQTRHIPSDSATNYVGTPTYAINQVFGGGNESDYTVGIKDRVYIHKCENTIHRLFGGGNAAKVYGVELWIDGGRHYWVFGGGNGERGPAYAAHIGAGGINIHLGGGNIQSLFNGSNENGDVQDGGSILLTTYTGCTESVIVDHFMGSNQTTIYGDITETIGCPSEMRFVNLYCGSNLSQIYGNINLTIKGGVFDRVFGGSKGSFNNPNNPPGFQTYESSIHDNPNTADVIEGHVNVLVTGGAIGELFGACDENGNVEGKVTLTIHKADNECGFFIGNIYGGGNMTDYVPDTLDNKTGGLYAYSPEIKLVRGIIGGTDSRLPVLPTNPNEFVGNVFGGGNEAHVTSNPRVIVGDGLDSPVTVKGNVFGGGNEGDVNGSPVVVVVPYTHTLSYSQPEANVGVVVVRNRIGDTLVSGSRIGEGLDADIKAIPSVYGFRFVKWRITGGDGIIADTTSLSTLFTMGTQDGTIEAVFGTATRHTLTTEVTPAGSGTITVTDGLGNALTSNEISEGAVLNIVATPTENSNYVFEGWEVTQGNGTVANATLPTTTFTMGTQNTTLKAIFRQQQRRQQPQR